MGLSKVDYINTLDNISDLGTKAVDATTLKTLAPAALGHDHRLIKKITDYITRRDDVRATSGKWIGSLIFSIDSAIGQAVMYTMYGFTTWEGQSQGIEEISQLCHGFLLFIAVIIYCGRIIWRLFMSWDVSWPITHDLSSSCISQIGELYLITIYTMASILDPFSGALSAKLVDIRAAVRTLQTELDDSGLASEAFNASNEKPLMNNVHQGWGGPSGNLGLVQ